jgi:hypothetical protein
MKAAAEARPPTDTRLGAAAYWLAASLGLAVTAIALHKMSLIKPLDHDEHQFIASGAGLARFGWLPYLDAPYHHLPYLSFLYAALSSVSDSLLGTARAVCVAASVGIAGLTAYAAADALANRQRSVRLAAGAAAVVVLIANPIFIYTSGRAWNHDVAMLLTLSAALLHMRWLAGNESHRRMFLAGALLAGAIGVRSSFALAIPAFVASFVLLGPAKLSSRIRATTAFAVGGFVALLPVALLFGLAPEQFLFGNLRYNVELNTEYRRLTDWPIAMDLSGKLEYMRTELLSHRRNALLLLLYIVAVGSACVQYKLAHRRAEQLFLALLLAMLLFAAWSPTPTWYQYFYATVPVIIVAASLALATHDSPRSAAIPLIVAGLLATTSLAGLRHYGAPLVADRNSSQVALSERIGEELARIAPPGPVATLGPLFALEANREIYPWLATGPFSIRTAALIDEHERLTLGLVAAEEISSALDERPPAAILVGVEPAPASPQGEGQGPELGDPEAALIEYARENGYEPHELSGGLVAWTPPEPPSAP